MSEEELEKRIAVAQEVVITQADAVRSLKAAAKDGSAEKVMLLSIVTATAAVSCMWLCQASA